LVIAVTSGRAARMAAAARAASPLEATSSMCAWSVVMPPQARARPASEVAAVPSSVSWNGNCAIPETRKRTGGNASAALVHDARTVTVSPGAVVSASASASLMTISSAPVASAPRTMVQGRCGDSLTPSKYENADVPFAPSIVASAKRTAMTARTDGSAAMVRTASLTRTICGDPLEPGGSSPTLTRTSQPVRSSRSRIERINPSESSSMSKSSAPTAATPSTPSEARAG
jgi:hypothetical protein